MLVHVPVRDSYVVQTMFKLTILLVEVIELIPSHSFIYILDLPENTIV